MKKILVVLLALALCFALFGCGKKDENKDTKDSSVSENKDTKDSSVSENTDEKKDDSDLKEDGNSALVQYIQSDEVKAKLEEMNADVDTKVRFEAEGSTVVVILQLANDLTDEDLADLETIKNDPEQTSKIINSLLANFTFEDLGVENLQYKVRVLDKDGNALAESPVQ